MTRPLSGVISCVALLLCVQCTAQSKADRKVIKQIREDIEYLASDELEGRRAASEGEKKAAFFIEERYRKIKIGPYNGSYQHPFKFVYGKEIAPVTRIFIGGKSMNLETEAFPLAFSANTDKPVKTDILPEVFEPGNVWLMGLYADEDEAKDPHFDYEKAMYEKVKEVKKSGAAAVIFYDNFNSKYAPRYNAHSEFEPAEIPVVFLTHQAYQSYIDGKEEGVPVELNAGIRRSEFTGTNVAGYIDNGALYTVVIGAHYDHLGYGHDGGSLYTGKDKQVHNGADDNASGTAGLMQLASWIKQKKLRNYNYLFLHFSAEELGLLGSKAFVKEMGLDSSKIAYMINMDMIGRLNDSTHALTVGGVGTSPEWGKYVSKSHKDFKIVHDSAGVGPSDHTSFYHAGIPVLFFFTGLHTDYHKPSDDADKVNYEGEVQVLHYIYSIVNAMDKGIKPGFTPTKQATVGKVRFKVTLGIMPDYSFQDGGVRVDGVSEDRPAIKAGIKAGDIIVQMDQLKIQGMQSYMEALSEFKSGQTIDVTVMRDGQPVTVKLTF